MPTLTHTLLGFILVALILLCLINLRSEIVRERQVKEANRVRWENRPPNQLHGD